MIPCHVEFQADEWESSLEELWQKRRKEGADRSSIGFLLASNSLNKLHRLIWPQDLSELFDESFPHTMSGLRKSRRDAAAIRYTRTRQDGVYCVISSAMIDKCTADVLDGSVVSSVMGQPCHSILADPSPVTLYSET